MTSIGLPSKSCSYWLDGNQSPTRPRLDGDREVDVLVIGAGITGLTCALMLQDAGREVVVIDGQGVGQSVSGHTSAHLTEAIDTRYTTLVDHFGESGARVAGEASREAIGEIARLVERWAIACDFRRVPGYLFAETADDLASLHQEYEATRKLGFGAEMIASVPLPFAARAALRFDDQAQFHAGLYVEALAKAFEGRGGAIFERTMVHELEDGEPCVVRTEHGAVRAREVVSATHVPLSRMELQTRIAHYQSYVLAAVVDTPPLTGLFWDMATPYHYLRSAPASEGGTSVLIVGGEDHKTGTEEGTLACFERLVDYTTKRFSVREVTHRWSSQVVEPVDGLPYIGRMHEHGHTFVATGFSGNGLTFGTAAARVIADAIRGVDNPWSETFAVGRVKPLASARRFVSENVDFPKYLVGDRLRFPSERPEDVARGEGKVVKQGSRRLAVFRDDEGAIHCFSAICPHLGCHVHFNAAEKSWDCPCHGSRFDVHGRVFNGPATENLEPVKLAAGKPDNDTRGPHHEPAHVR